MGSEQACRMIREAVTSRHGELADRVSAQPRR
jgi:hypothetical protein